jgi:hypothetical protein
MPLIVLKVPGIMSAMNDTIRRNRTMVEPELGEPLYSLEQACLEVGGYPRLVRALVREYNVVHWKVSGRIVFNSRGVEKLRVLVDDWKNRKRIFRANTST